MTCLHVTLPPCLALACAQDRDHEAARVRGVGQGAKLLDRPPRVVRARAEEVEHETGLVAVTAYGMTLANSRLADLSELRKFKEDIAVLLVSGVFVILTADLTPQIIASALNMNTLLYLVCMLFLVRPLSVWIATAGTLSRNEALLLGWIAPRGIVAVAVSGLFGSLLVDLSREGRFFFSGADQIVPLAFAMVFTTVVLHGFTIGPLARRLGPGGPGLVLVPWPGGLFLVAWAWWPGPGLGLGDRFLDHHPPEGCNQ